MFVGITAISVKYCTEREAVVASRVNIGIQNTHYKGDIYVSEPIPIIIMKNEQKNAQSLNR